MSQTERYVDICTNLLALLLDDLFDLLCRGVLLGRLLGLERRLLLELRLRARALEEVEDRLDEVRLDGGGGSGGDLQCSQKCLR